MKAVRFIVIVFACLLAGFIGSIFTAPSIPTWYAALNKPVFTPPNWLFGPAWTLLYVLMGTAAFLILEKGWGDKAVKFALALFAVQLIINSLWSIVFFDLHRPFYAFLTIIVLWLMILWTIINFFKLSKAAGWLMIPYILWVSFASVLNLSVALLNR